MYAKTAQQATIAKARPPQHTRSALQAITAPPRPSTLSSIPALQAPLAMPPRTSRSRTARAALRTIIASTRAQSRPPRGSSLATSTSRRDRRGLDLAQMIQRAQIQAPAQRTSTVLRARSTQCLARTATGHLGATPRALRTASRASEASSAASPRSGPNGIVHSTRRPSCWILALLSVLQSMLGITDLATQALSASKAPRPGAQLTTPRRASSALWGTCARLVPQLPFLATLGHTATQPAAAAAPHALTVSTAAREDLKVGRSVTRAITAQLDPRRLFSARSAHTATTLASASVKTAMTALQDSIVRHPAPLSPQVRARLALSAEMPQGWQPTSRMSGMA